eukprot:scaffold3206_cov742-Pavlova_lutheri.AAC.1
MPRNPTLDWTNAKVLDRCLRQQNKQVSRCRATTNNTSLEQTRSAINSAHALPVNQIFSILQLSSPQRPPTASHSHL